MKNKFTLYYLTVAFTFCLYGCNQPKEKDVNQIKETTVINFTNKENKQIYDIAKNIQIIPLESNEKSIFKDISQIEITKNNYLILDISTRQIIAFDKKGKFNGKIETIGQAPGEYILPISFTVDEKKNKIFIIDLDNKIICYDLRTFEYLYEYEKSIGMSMTLINKGFAAFNFTSLILDEKTYNEHVIITNDSLEVINSFLPIDFSSGYIMTPTNRFYNYNKKTFVFPPFSNLIYQITDTTLNAFYEIKYGNYTLAPLSFNNSKNETGNYIQRLYKTDYIRHFQPFENNDFFLMSYYRRDFKCLGVYAKKQKKAYYIETSIINSKHNLLHKIIGVYNNQFVSFGYYGDLKIKESLLGNNKFEDDTPLLIIFDIE